MLRTRVTQAVAADKATTIIIAIAGKGIAAANFHGDAIGACSARAREVALAAGVANPVPTLMATLFRHLTDAIGPEAAARLLISANLMDIDRAVARDLVFGQRSDTNPFDN